MPEALYSSFPFTSPKGIEFTVNAAGAVDVGPRAPEPVDFEQPAVHATQSVTSSARVIKPQDAWSETGRLKSFEHIPIFSPLMVNRGQQFESVLSRPRACAGY